MIRKSKLKGLRNLHAFFGTRQKPRTTMEYQNVDNVKILTREIYICEDCYELKGDMCHTPECNFCRKTMDEVGNILNATLIRPVIDGKRLRL